MPSKRPIKPAVNVEHLNPSSATGGGVLGPLPDIEEQHAKTEDDDSASAALSPITPTTNKKRRASKQPASSGSGEGGPSSGGVKRTRTNTPWTATEEQRLKSMRDAGNSWSDIAKTFPTRTEGSVKKHWYKDMHYAEFAEDESAALLAAIKEYDANKWKVIGSKVNKPAKACEQYAKEHFTGK
ncbi:hypothetical protein DFP73DRAFT_471305 [Morchella snyderi]|nr:hypothetical protein DFP73DRAFT_471305 [Morchella snyderi]